MSGGSGVRIAIIDSGIDAGHPALGAGVQGYVAIRQPSRCEELVYEFDAHADEAGHGTTCAVLVRSVAPGCELYSVKVLGARCLGRASALMAGVRWAIEHQMDVCNLSLGTVREQHAAAMHDLTDEASARNMVLVAAANERGVPSYPAACPSVISVASHPIRDRTCFWSDPNKTVDFLAWGTDVPVFAPDGTLTVQSGSSLAAAHMTGLIATILGEQRGLRVCELRGLLHELAANPRGVQLRDPVPSM